MRSIDFKKQTSELRILKENNRKKKLNWDRIIYLCILFSMLGALLWFLFWKILMISAVGNVLTETFKVQFVNDVKVISLKVKEGQEVKKGDTLFTYVHDKSLEIDKNIGQKYLQDSIEYEKEMQLLKQEIKFKEAEISATDKMMKLVRKQMEKMQEEIALDVYTADKLNPVNSQFNDLSEKKNLLTEQMAILKHDLDVILTMKAFAHESAADILGVNVLAYVAPMDGQISHIFKKDHEVAHEHEFIVSLMLPTDNVLVKAYFDQKDLHMLKINDIVNVKFANGEISKGRIERFYYDAYELPIHLSATDKATFQMNIEADIVPLVPADVPAWQLNQKQSVEVYKSKYF